MEDLPPTTSRDESRLVLHDRAVPESWTCPVYASRNEHCDFATAGRAAPPHRRTSCNSLATAPWVSAYRVRGRQGSRLRSSDSLETKVADDEKRSGAGWCCSRFDRSRAGAETSIRTRTGKPAGTRCRWKRRRTCSQG